MQVEYFEKIVPATWYIENFTDLAACRAACRACGEYGKSWSCPPYEKEPDFSPYKTVKIICARITPGTEYTSISSARKMFGPVKAEMRKRLLAEERETGGMAMGFAGNCDFCTGECTRIKGAPCRFPTMSRPSLEACGFNVMQTAKELFGLEMLWSIHGEMPHYLLLVSAIFF